MASIHSDELQRGYPTAFQAFDDGWERHAKDDHITYFPVQSNDAGSAAKTISSIGHGTTNVNLQGPYDPDKICFSEKGARLSIVTMGEHAGAIAYDGASFGRLAQGEIVVDSFNYAVQLGSCTPVWSSVWITVTGTNDKPVVSGIMTGYSTEDGVTVSLNALEYVSDIDTPLSQVSVVLAPEAVGKLPAGVYFDSFTQTTAFLPVMART